MGKFSLYNIPIFVCDNVHISQKHCQVFYNACAYSCGVADFDTLQSHVHTVHTVRRVDVGSSS